MATESLTTRNSRRALLAAACGGLAAAAAQALGRPLPALAGHGDTDGADSLHLERANTTDENTSLEGTSNQVTLTLRNTGGADALELESDGQVMVARLLGGSTNHTAQFEHDGVGGGAAVFARGTNSGVAGEGLGEGAVGVVGYSQSGRGVQGESNGDAPGVQGVSGSGFYGNFGQGSSPGVQGISGSGPGVQGMSNIGPGIAGNSQSGDGVAGHSETGIGGRFSTSDGSNACYVSGNATSFALGVDNSSADEGAGGILAVARGGKPVIEGDAFPSDFNPGVGVQGVSYSGTSYQDGAFGEGPGTGVQGLSGDGPGVEGRSHRASGVVGVTEAGPEEAGQTVAGVEGHGPMTDDPSGYGVVGVGHVGVHGRGGIVGVDGRATNAFAGNFVNDGTADGAGVRAISPGDRPAVFALSGIEAEGGQDGVLALDVVGKARFSTAGAATVPQGQNSVFVANAAVTSDSHISITLVSDPGPRQLRWIQRTGGSGFTVHFAGGPPGQRPATQFTYLIVEPSA